MELLDMRIILSKLLVFFSVLETSGLPVYVLAMRL